MIVNTIILGNMKVEGPLCHKDLDPNNNQGCSGPKEHLAAYGLGQSLIALALLSTGTTYANGLSNLIPQAYGAGNKELVCAYRNRMIILVSMIFLPLLIPL